MVGGYGRDFEVTFISEENEVMIVNRLENENTRTWRLEGNELQQTQEYK